MPQTSMTIPGRLSGRIENIQMIYTITLNTALDRTIFVKSTHADDCNRIDKEQVYAGGKGVDVSKVLTALGVANKALGFVGGFAGDELEGLLINEGIACNFVRISGGTRTNIIINETDSGSQTLFNARGPEIKPYELMQMIHKVEKLDLPEFVIISGSLPPGVNPEIYRKIIEIVKSSGAKAVLDTDGEALKTGLLGQPDIIKPNVHELSRLAGQRLEKIDEIIDAAHKIREQGIETVLVSMGVRGMLLVGNNMHCMALPPKVEAINTIGAGDSAVAGFIYGLVNGKSLPQALACAVAAGTATISRPGTALCQRDDFHNLLPQVTLQYENTESGLYP
jgi:6-phosphofructokinase 2